MQLNLGALFGAPDLHFFAIEKDHALFARMDRAAYRRSIFLDARIAPADSAMLRIPLGPLLKHVEDQRAISRRTGWIFHVAQCGSTLLARALEGDANLILREPMPLRQLAVAAEPASPAWRLQLKLAAVMVGRRYGSEFPSVVKATVPVNFILDELAALDAAAPAICLYFAFEPYLLAVLRSPRHRQWVQRVTGELAGRMGLAPGELARLTDAQRAAALWQAQISAFDAMMRRMPDSRSLDAETLFNAPRETIAAAAALFDRPMPPAELDAVVASDLFATYSKNPALPFDNDLRRARQAEAAQMLAPEIAEARAWLEPRLAAAPLPARLGRPLAGESPLLF